MWDGAEKCLLRDLDRSEETCLLSFIFGGNETSLQDGKLNLILKRISQYKEMHRFLRGTTWLSGHKSFREKLRKLLKIHSEPV